MDINEIINLENRQPQEIVDDLKRKSIVVPSWGGRVGLEREYNPRKHPVMSRAIYPDIVNSDGSVERVTRVTYDLQRLAVKRMSELCNGIPVKRVYKAENDRQKEVAAVMEKIYQRNRIDSLNNERCTMLFAGCEVMTLWYAVEDRNTAYGITSPLKIRCRNFSPMMGDSLYPLFDEYGDLIALSVGYIRRVADDSVEFFDAYTKDAHYKWARLKTGWVLQENEQHIIGKIPAVYVWRPTPIWEHTSPIVSEIEWAMSRNGNYLRKNSKPLFVVMADEAISYGDEKGEMAESRAVMQYPKGSTANYVTWNQAIENLQFYVTELRHSFFTQLQLPDFSFEKMSSTPMSGESRKQLFIDSQLKVADESGRLLEFYDREVNVVRQFVKVIMGASYEQDIDALQVESVITPFSINDEKDTITNLVTANGGKPIISQRESIEQFGLSSDVDATMAQIASESMQDAFELTE